MISDPTRRFTGRGGFYAMYRPSYPKGALRILQQEIGLTKTDVVADIGSGTGILSRLFLENGNTVFAVEPNESMRTYADRDLGGFVRFKSVRGTAERTLLQSGSVDLIAVGQALHWFDPPQATREFARISKPEASLCILYNERKEEGAFMHAYEALVEQNEKGRARVPRLSSEDIERYFKGGNHSTFHLPNSQALDFDGLLGRLLSASYMPRPSQKAGFAKLRDDIHRIFDAFNVNGFVTILYDTKVFLGGVARASNG